MLENFEVIEIKKVVEPKEAPLNIIVEPKRIRFVKAVTETLGYPPYVRFLANTKGQQFAVQIGRGNESNTYKFSKPKEKQKSAILIQNEIMMAVVWDMMPEWNRETKYIITGTYSKEDKAIIFNLKTPVPYERKQLMKSTLNK